MSCQTAVSSIAIMSLSLYENFTRSRLACNTYAISLSISFSRSFWDSVVFRRIHNPCLVMNFCIHPMLAVNVGGSSISLHSSLWRNLALLLIIFLDTRKPLERPSWTHSNKNSSNRHKIWRKNYSFEGIMYSHGHYSWETQTKTTVFVIHYYVCQLWKEDKPRLIRTLKAL